MNSTAFSLRVRVVLGLLLAIVGVGVAIYFNSDSSKNSNPSDAARIEEVKKGFGAYLQASAKTEQLKSAEFTSTPNSTVPSGWDIYQMNKKIDYKAFQGLGGSVEKSDAKYIYQSSLSIKIPKDTAFRQTLTLKEKDRYLLNAYLKVHSGKVNLIYQFSGTEETYTQTLTPNADNSWQTIGKSLQVSNTPQEAVVSLVADEDTQMTLNFITVQPMSSKQPVDGSMNTGGFFLNDEGEWQSIQTELSPQTKALPSRVTAYRQFFKDVVGIGVQAQNDTMDVPVRIMLSTQAYSYIVLNADYANPGLRIPSQMFERAFAVWDSYNLKKRLVVAPIIEFDETNPLYNVCPIEITKGFGLVSAFGLAPVEYCDPAPPLTYLIKTPNDQKYLRSAETNPLVGGNIYIGPGLFQSQHDLNNTIMHETSHVFFRAHYNDAYSVMRNDVNGRTYMSPYIEDYLGADDRNNNALLEHTRTQIGQAGIGPLGLFDPGPKTNEIPTTWRLVVGDRPLSNVQYTVYANSSAFEILLSKHKPSHILNTPALRPSGTTDGNGLLTLSSTSWPAISFVNLIMAFSPSENKWYYGWADTAIGNIKKWNGVGQWTIAMLEDPGPEIQITYPREGMVIDQQNNRFELRGLIDARDIKSYEIFIDNRSVGGGDTVPESDLLSRIAVTRGIAPGNHTYRVEVTRNFLDQKTSKSVNFVWAPVAANLLDCTTDKLDVCLRYQSEGRACQWFACGKGICQPNFVARPQQCAAIDIVKPLGLSGPRKAENASFTSESQGFGAIVESSNTNERYMEWRPLNQQFYPYPLELRITNVASGVESYSSLFIPPGSTTVEIPEYEWSKLLSGEQYAWRLCAYPRIDSEEAICASDEFTKSGSITPPGPIQCNTTCVYSENNKCYIGRCTSSNCGTNLNCSYGGAACGYGASEEVLCEDVEHGEHDHAVPPYRPFDYTPIPPLQNPSALQVTVRNTASASHGVSTIGFALYKNGNEFIQDFLSFPNSTNTYAIDLKYMDPNSTYRLEPRAKSFPGPGNDINTVSQEVVRCKDQTGSQSDCSIVGGGSVEMIISDSGNSGGGAIPTPEPESTSTPMPTQVIASPTSAPSTTPTATPTIGQGQVTCKVSGIPTSAQVGQSITATFEVRNGTHVPMTGGNRMSIRSNNGTLFNPVGSFEADIPAYGTVTRSVTMTAQTSTGIRPDSGSYADLSWGMTSGNGQGWGDCSDSNGYAPRIEITARPTATPLPLPYQSSCITNGLSSLPAQLATGQKHTITMALKNTGTQPWLSDGSFRVDPIEGPSYAGSFQFYDMQDNRIGDGFQGFPIPTSIQPNGTLSLTFKMQFSGASGVSNLPLNFRITRFHSPDTQTLESGCARSLSFVTVAAPTSIPAATSTIAPTSAPLAAIGDVVTSCNQFGLVFSYPAVPGAENYEMKLTRRDAPFTQSTSYDSAQRLCTGGICTQTIDAPSGSVYGQLQITASSGSTSRTSTFQRQFYCPVAPASCPFTQTVRVHDRFGNQIRMDASLERTFNSQQVFEPRPLLRVNAPLPRVEIQNGEATVTQQLEAGRQLGEERSQLVLGDDYKLLDSTCTSTDGSLCGVKDVQAGSQTVRSMCASTVDTVWSLACTKYTSTFTVAGTSQNKLSQETVSGIGLQLEHVPQAGSPVVVGQWPMDAASVVGDPSDFRGSKIWSPAELSTRISGAGSILQLGDQIRAKPVLPQGYRVAAGTGGTFDPTSGTITVPLQCGGEFNPSWTIEPFASKTWTIRPEAVCRTEDGGTRPVEMPWFTMGVLKKGTSYQLTDNMISRLGDITLTNDNAPQNMAFGLFIPWAANQPSAVNVPTNLSSQTRSVPIVIPGFGGNPDTTTNFNLSMVEWNSESVPAGEVRLQFTAPDGVCNPNDSKQAEDIPEEGDPEPFYRVAATDSFPTSTGKVGMSSVAFMSESPIVAGSEVNFIVPQLDDETGVEKIAVYIKKQGGSSGKFNVPSRWEILTVLNCLEQDCSKGVQPLTLPKDLQPGTYDVALMIADHAKSQNGEHIGIVAPEFIKDTPFGPSTKPCTESTANATYCTTEGLSTTITVGSN